MISDLSKMEYIGLQLFAFLVSFDHYYLHGIDNCGFDYYFC